MEDLDAGLQLEPAARTTLAQTVTERLLRLILDNGLEPGDKFPSEKQLTEQLQVGRSTVREALKTLRALGMVDMRPGQGTVVGGLDLRRIVRPDLLSHLMDRVLTEQLLEAREIIEPEIANLAAQRATEEDLATLCGLLAETEERIKEGQPVHRLGSGFHRAVTEAAHNEFFTMFMDSALGLLAERGLLLEQKPGYVEWELASHQEIYETIVQRDGNRAKLAMARHIGECTAQQFQAM